MTTSRSWRGNKWPPRNKPHIYKKLSGRREWVVRYYDPIAKRIYAYHGQDRTVIFDYAHMLALEHFIRRTK